MIYSVLDIRSGYLPPRCGKLKRAPTGARFFDEIAQA
jgi:hypothetical protein